MPGVASLLAQRYYAHPQNLFWTIMRQALQIHANADYETCVGEMQMRGFALWDVLGYCERKGSLDSAIVRDSEQVNDLTVILQAHPISRILFNGKKAEQIFDRHLYRIRAGFEEIRFIGLPSTSPANASIPRSVKIQAWLDVITEKIT